MHTAVVFSFWVIGWIVYLLNNLASTNFIQPYFGVYFAHLYRNISIIPLYMILAYYYIGVLEIDEVKTWSTGLIWLLLSLIADSVLWFFVVGYDVAFIVNALKFWEGSLYPIQLLALALSVPLMKWYIDLEPTNPMLLFWLYGLGLLVLIQILAGYKLYQYIRYTWAVTIMQSTG